MLYQIFVESYYQLPNGRKTIVIDVFEETNILSIKQKFLKFTGVPINRQILKFKMNNLEDSSIIHTIPGLKKDVILILYIKAKNENY
jgi:hypothetical protein